MKKYIPVFICLFLTLIFLVISMDSRENKHINTYPNLPAPIGVEKILITSAGQAPEGTILLSIAENLNLDADYRPRALSTDLYDYQSVVIVLGYSANGLAHTPRSFQEEIVRTKHLVMEANRKGLPIILTCLSGQYRADGNTWKLFEKIVPFADYYIGLKETKNVSKLLNTLKTHHVPSTLVNQLADIQIPFNSVFR
ncbi:DUF6305 family protein [Virgibacillus oceani]|uniref:DUF6305 domain-containing protein n=1 Tax=Virgibacillus oceani TaxID=1479511 RepID=A0A917H487_9BACI|nr:DUF6305 family protein [Virgibacillus oceani]GGG67049.1 hypothetical protein GCM10011398_08440 [Virgibacillus oceani]